MIDGRWWEWERASGKDWAVCCLCWYVILFFVYFLVFFFFFNMVVRCLFFGLFFFWFYFFFFFNIVLTWKFVEASKASVLYIYIDYLQINHSKILSFWVNHKSVLILKEINLKWNSFLETTVYRGALSFYTHFSRRQNSWEILPQEHLRIIWLNYFESFF